MLFVGDLPSHEIFDLLLTMLDVIVRWDPHPGLVIHLSCQNLSALDCLPANDQLGRP
jgi:hypothetical protein